MTPHRADSPSAVKRTHSLLVFLSDGACPVVRIPPWIGYQVRCEHLYQQANTSTDIITYPTVVDNNEEIYFTYLVFDGGPHTRYMLTYSGQYQLQSWNTRCKQLTRSGRNLGIRNSNWGKVR